MSNWYIQYGKASYEVWLEANDLTEDNDKNRKEYVSCLLSRHRYKFTTNGTDGSDLFRFVDYKTLDKSNSKEDVYPLGGHILLDYSSGNPSLEYLKGYIENEIKNGQMTVNGNHMPLVTNTYNVGASYISVNSDDYFYIISATHTPYKLYFNHSAFFPIIQDYSLLKFFVTKIRDMNNKAEIDLMWNKVNPSLKKGKSNKPKIKYGNFSDEKINVYLNYSDNKKDGKNYGIKLKLLKAMVSIKSNFNPDDTVYDDEIELLKKILSSFFVYVDQEGKKTFTVKLDSFQADLISSSYVNNIAAFINGRRIEKNEKSVSERLRFQELYLDLLFKPDRQSLIKAVYSHFEYMQIQEDALPILESIIDLNMKHPKKEEVKELAAWLQNQIYHIAKDKHESKEDVSRYQQKLIREFISIGKSFDDVMSYMHAVGKRLRDLSDNVYPNPDVIDDICDMSYDDFMIIFSVYLQTNLYEFKNELRQSQF
jgi:hypothetical protein